MDIGVDTRAAVQQSTPASLSKGHMSDGGSGSAAVGARLPSAGAQVKDWRTVAELLLNSSQLECKELCSSLKTSALYANQDPLVRQTIIPLGLLRLPSRATSIDKLRVSSGCTHRPVVAVQLPFARRYASCLSHVNVGVASAVLSRWAGVVGVQASLTGQPCLGNGSRCLHDAKR